MGVVHHGHPPVLVVPEKPLRLTAGRGPAWSATATTSAYQAVRAPSLVRVRIGQRARTSLWSSTAAMTLSEIARIPSHAWALIGSRLRAAV